MLERSCFYKPLMKPLRRRKLQPYTTGNNISLLAYISLNLLQMLTQIYSASTQANYSFMFSSVSTGQGRKGLLSCFILHRAMHVALQEIKKTLSAWTTFQFPYFVCSKRKLSDSLCLVYLEAVCNVLAECFDLLHILQLIGLAIHLLHLLKPSLSKERPTAKPA